MSKTVEEVLNMMLDRQKIERVKAAEAAYWQWYDEALKKGWSDNNARRYDCKLAFTAGYVTGAAHGAAERGSYDDGYDDGLSEGKRIGAAEEREWMRSVIGDIGAKYGWRHDEYQKPSPHWYDILTEIEARIRQRGEGK